MSMKITTKDNCSKNNCSKINCSKNSNICFWDKHYFEGKKIHCPIFYKPKQVVRKKREYYFNQNICKDNNGHSPETSIIKEEIFFDDVFCSYECCLAWIDDNSNNPKYKNSKQILFNIFDVPLNRKANHWKTLENFGGFLTIEQFRKFDKTFIEVDNKYVDNFSTTSYREIINVI